MIKSSFVIILLAITFYSCSSAGQMQSDSGASASDAAPSEEMVAPWYDHNNKAISDSLSFTGLGMAIATDSSDAMMLAREQANAYLNFAIDTHAEELRQELAENDGSNSLTSPQFILSLRRAVRELSFEDSELTIEQDYSQRENGSVIAYSKVSAPRDVSLEKLMSAIDNETFSGALRESMTR